MKKTVLITGSSKGIGKSLAETFAYNDYGVILHGRNKARLEEVAGQIKDNVIDIIEGDLRENNTLDRLYNSAKKNDLGVLINNAAMLCPGLFFEDLTNEQIEEMITTNLIVPIKLTGKIYPLMIEKKEGTIININAICGIEPKKIRTIYCASKWGLRGFANSLRLGAKENNVRIISIYTSQVKSKPEFSRYGWNLKELSERVLEFYEKGGNSDELIMEGRPEKYRPKRYHPSEDFSVFIRSDIDKE